MKFYCVFIVLFFLSFVYSKSKIKMKSLMNNKGEENDLIVKYSKQKAKELGNKRMTAIESDLIDNIRYGKQALLRSNNKDILIYRV